MNEIAQASKRYEFEYHSYISSSDVGYTLHAQLGTGSHWSENGEV